MNKFVIGQRVILPANPEEEWPEERGVVIGVQAITTYVYMVQVPDGVDGLREVSEDDMLAEDAQ